MAAHWHEIGDADGQTEYTDGTEQTTSFLTQAAKNLGIALHDRNIGKADTS